MEDMWNPALKLGITKTQRKELLKLVKGRNTPQKMVMRAKIVLLAGSGEANHAIAQGIGVNRKTVILWRGRFRESGIAGLKDSTRPGRKVKIAPRMVRRVIDMTLQEKPRAGTHWSNRTLGKELHISKMAVQRIWVQHGLKPHLVRTFKLSRDKHFVEKLEDVVGLYLNPPEHAVVFSVDEKSQIQALDRTQPGLPMKKGRAETMTHDYKRNGTTTLFAALDVFKGKVIGSCMPRHRHQEFLKFLKLIEEKTPKTRDVHLIVDNYGTHKHPRVKAWAVSHPRFHFHFIPTSSSWLNLVERWFREITTKRIRRGVFHSVENLITAIEEYLAVHNENPKPFIWTATVQSILSKINRVSLQHNIVQKR
jgi:transposase